MVQNWEIAEEHDATIDILGAVDATAIAVAGAAAGWDGSDD
jgi:hypothetical protein